jgi:hypothetical protein
MLLAPDEPMVSFEPSVNAPDELHQRDSQKLYDMEGYRINYCLYIGEHRFI